jgi:hypothetical protein
VNGNNLIDLLNADDNADFAATSFEQYASEPETNIINNGVGLIVALVLSLGLWAMIWVAVCALIGSAPI